MGSHALDVVVDIDVMVEICSDGVLCKRSRVVVDAAVICGISGRHAMFAEVRAGSSSDANAKAGNLIIECAIVLSGNADLWSWIWPFFGLNVQLCSRVGGRGLGWLDRNHASHRSRPS